MNRLRDELRAEAAPVLAAILDHPFLAGLVDGSLTDAAFGYFLQQDAWYLQRFAQALAALAGRAVEAGDVEMFSRHASGALAVERTMHAALLAELGIDEPAVPSPTTVAYTSYLLATVASRPYPQAVGAVLPCYRIYAEVGRELARRGSPVPRYQRWIDAYADEGFAALVEEVLTVADREGAALGPADRRGVREAYLTASRYEWMFWDAALRRERWPV